MQSRAWRWYQRLEGLILPRYCFVYLCLLSCHWNSRHGTHRLQRNARKVANEQSFALEAVNADSSYMHWVINVVDVISLSSFLIAARISLFSSAEWFVHQLRCVDLCEDFASSICWHLISVATQGHGDVHTQTVKQQFLMGIPEPYKSPPMVSTFDPKFVLLPLAHRRYAALTVAAYWVWSQRIGLFHLLNGVSNSSRMLELVDSPWRFAG